MSEDRLMPNYDFRNKETGEIIEVSMSMTALDKYKEEHPELERYFGNQGKQENASCASSHNTLIISAE